MAVIGRDSFYIMGLHFLTFKLGSCSLNAVSNLNLNPADLMAPAHNVLLYIAYRCANAFSYAVDMEKIKEFYHT